MSAQEDYAVLQKRITESWAETQRLQQTIADDLKAQAKLREEASEEASLIALEVLEEQGLSAFKDPSLAPLLYTIGWSDGMGSSVWRKTVQELVSALDPYISSVSGGWRVPDDGTVSFVWSVRMPPVAQVEEERLARTVEFLEGIYGGAKDIHSDGAPFRFDIFEHTLREYGSYYLVMEDGKWRIATSYYGSSSFDDGYESLRDALLQVARDHWYE